MQHSFQTPIYETIIFWISVGLFVYASGIFFYILLITNSNKADVHFLSQLKVVYAFVTIIKNIVLSIALFKSNKEDNFKDDKTLNLPSELDLDSFYPNNNLN
jgi:hypothetical protein